VRVFFYPSLSEFGNGSGRFSHSDALHGKLSSKPHDDKLIIIIKNKILIYFII